MAAGIIGTTHAAQADASSYTLDIPSGAAAGDSMLVQWAAHYVGADFPLPPTVLTGDGLIHTGDEALGDNTASPTDFLACGYYQLVLDADSVSDGFVTIGAANLLDIDGNGPGTYPQGTLAYAVAVSGGSFQLSAEGGAVTPNFSAEGTDWLGILWLSTFGGWWDAGPGLLTNDTYATDEAVFNADTRLWIARAHSAQDAPLPGSTTWSTSVSAVAGYAAAAFIFIASTDLAVDTPIALTVTPGAPTIGTLDDMPVGTPIALTLTGGTPTLEPPGVAPVEMPIGTPFALTITGGAPTLAPTTDTVVLPSMTAELDLGGHLDHFYQSLPDSAVTTHDPIAVVFEPHSTLEVSSPVYAIKHLGLSQARLLPTVVLSHSTPIIVNGKPTLPKYLARYDSTMPCIVGQANIPPDHIHAIADPNPVWDPFTSGWFIQPPASGVGDARWTVDSLPDPSPFSGQFYWLGTPSSEDGTSGIATGCRQWAPDGSTPSAPSWQSIYPYKPSVREHVFYGPGGQIVTKTKGVRFNLQFIEHMWADWGSDIPTPFSWVMVGIIMDFPNAGYQHTILDVGGNPADFGAPGLNENDLAPDRNLTDGAIDGDNRARIVTSINNGFTSADQSLAAIGYPFDFATRPKMWFGVWDGANSIAGSYSTAGKYIQGGALASSSQRHMVVGRAAGKLSRNSASHLVLFEMRSWHSALVEEQLDDQYQQLSSTWSFGAYA